MEVIHEDCAVRILAFLSPLPFGEVLHCKKIWELVPTLRVSKSINEGAVVRLEPSVGLVNLH